MSQAAREIEFGACSSPDIACGGQAVRPAAPVVFIDPAQAEESMVRLRARLASGFYDTQDACDECGVEGEELFEGVCMSCSVEDGHHSTLYARGGSVA